MTCPAWMNAPARFTLAVVFLIYLGAIVTLGQERVAAEKKSRPAWTTSRVVGSPDPPHPYSVERVFPKLSFRKATHIEACPVGERFFVAEQDGKIVSFVPTPNVEKPDLFLDLPREVKGCKPDTVVKKFGHLYALTFHPKFERNRYVYVTYTLETHEKKGLNAIERVSRLTVRPFRPDEPPRCDPDSELVIIEWRTEPGGHNGGCLRFGPDGFLYISMGDAAPPSPPDMYDAGQDLNTVHSKVLRIDVDREEGGNRYAVPKNNPFVDVAGARPEIWAYGFRNPWKMSFDRATGDLWVGDVGWELWEMVYRVRKGGNYGWSVMEGPQAVRPTAKRGPTPILPPAIAWPHSEAASIIGGHVYRGSKFKDLIGSYVCGDWMTYKLWATRFDGDRQISHREIAQGRQKIVAFAEDRQGELFWLDYDETGPGGGIYTLAVNDKAAHDPAAFPRKLSQTGLFASVAQVAHHEPAAGVVPYTINAEPWMDHATAERLVAVPGTGTVKVHDTPQRVPGTSWFTTRYFFPKDSVVLKTMGVEKERGNPRSRRRVETQLLHFDGEEWRGYSYRWNAEQTDAELVPSIGAEAELTARDPEAPGSIRKQTWAFNGRGACLQCHNPWAWTLLGFTVEQLDRKTQLTEMQQMELLTRVDRTGKPQATDEPLRAKMPFPSPYDPAADLAARARAYLHVNCCHCHQSGAGGTAQIDFRFANSLAELKAIDQSPIQGTFAIANARLVASGDPFRSIIYYRMAKTGSGRMPHVGSEIVDRAGLALMHDWIRALPVKDQVPANVEDAACLDRICAKAGDAAARTRDIDRLLASTGGALRLARALDANELSAEVRNPVIETATRRTDVSVRDLFERFLPAEKRVKRLGTLIRPETILAIKGDPARGKELFFAMGATQCANCHKVGGVGSALGPDLSQIGKKYDRAKLLESILDPSKEIDKAYVAYTLQTADGRLLTGLIVKRDTKEILLRDAQDKEHRVPVAQVELLEASKKSLMPEQLLRDLTAQQAADLLDYLAALK
jgi:putative heme-binding domain-containing protein